MVDAMIEVQDLTKSYGTLNVLKGLSFNVQSGEVFSLLGPNGAGKTTTLSIIEGLKSPDSGRVLLFGMDMQEHPQQIKQRIGVQLQATSLIPDLTAIEQIKVFSALYGRKLNQQEALAFLERVSLASKANEMPDKFSGGQQKRLVLAMALVNDPDIIFLDEPTAGLDPQARHALWDIVRSLKQQGKTILLTTHYMDEAEMLSDRVGIIDDGRLLALDTPRGLIEALDGMASIKIKATMPKEMLESLSNVNQIVRENGHYRIYTKDVMATNAELLNTARENNLQLQEMQMEQPSLEDVFLKLTGRTLRD